MTKEEAKQIIATWLVSSKGTKGQRGYIEGWFDEEDVEAFRMAIEALKAPTENTNTPTDTPTELISRDKAVNLVLNVCNDVMDECETVTGIYGEEVYTDVREVDAILKCNKRIRNGIRQLSSAEPKTGKWIEESDNHGHSSYFCSRCGTQEGEPSGFCPNCGARMKGADDETD